MIPLVAMFAGVAFITGNQLYDDCQGKSLAICGAFIAGVSDEIDGLQGTGRLPKAMCISMQVSVGQAANAVLKYLVDHPELRNHTAASLTESALLEAFPCPK
jgi:hypothetical protein